MRGEIRESNWKGLDFEWSWGSTMWPSDDPLDSPFDIFRCRRCGWEFNHATCGWILNVGDNRFHTMSAAEVSAERHFNSRCEYISYPPNDVPVIMHGEGPCFVKGIGR